ncbi:MAG: ATP-binding protein [Candidatus Moranbacteria bacterium]|nr:ATP-binding protein [Candidatus Moranbacteria bacterium]
MISTEIIINLINSFKKNDRQEIDNVIKSLIETAEKRKQYKLAKKLRETYALTSENHFLPSSHTPSKFSNSHEQDSKLFEIRRSKIRIGDIILSDTNKETLQEIINNYKKRDLLRKHGLSNDSRLILHGPPGTGKTLFAYVIAGELGVPIYHVYLDSLISSYLGETGRNLKEIFREASTNDCILLLDEFDAIAKHRDDSQELGELKRVVTVLLQNIDDLSPDTILIAATNHDHLLDSAVWRRFDYALKMDVLSTPLRKSLIQMNLNKNNIDVSILAELSEGLSGAIIKQIINKSLRKSLLDKNASALEKILIENFLIETAGKNDKLKGGQRKNFIKAIKYLRKSDQSKYTFEKLEKITGISSSTIHNIINK